MNNQKKNILITGGCGFIASHIIEYIYNITDWNIIIIDKLSYASNGLSRISDIKLLNNERIKIFTFDLIHKISVGIIKEIGDLNYILHMSAETHVDNAIKYPVDCVTNNILSTLNILEYSRLIQNTLEKFFYFSTDEVYGSAPNNIFYNETHRHNPTNPYSASKSASEQICMSYKNTYNIPVVIVNVMNAFGERQHVEKFIPKCIKYILEDKVIPIHCDSLCENSGSRFYIHCKNIASAIMFLIEKSIVGEFYHIAGEKEITNLDMAMMISKILKKELKYELVNFHEDRPGHDLRYSLDGSKLKNMGWELPEDFEDSLEKTINWTLNNKKWLEE